MEFWWAYLLIGLGCGVFSAVFGVGSGILLIPALVLIFALPQKSAQGVCLAVMVPMAFVGAMRYRLNPDIDVNFTVVALLSIGAMVGALFGSSLAAWASGPTLRRLFALIMIVVALKMLLSSPKGQDKASAVAENLVEKQVGEAPLPVPQQD